MAQEKVEALMPGKILDVNISLGCAVQEGDILCILESMKMENPIIAPVSGVVKEVMVSPGQYIQTGELAVIIEY